MAEAQTMYLCEHHGFLPRSATHLGFSEPVGGRLECNFCPEPKPPVFLKEVMVTQQNTFDLQAFRKEIERRLEIQRERHATAAGRGWEEYEPFHDGQVTALEGVLALLPGEER